MDLILYDAHMQYHVQDANKTLKLTLDFLFLS